MKSRRWISAVLALAILLVAGHPGSKVAAADPASPKPKGAALNVLPRPIAGDPSVKYDYDIVYVRAPRRGDDQQIFWTDVFAPLQAEPGSDLVLLHPDGREEVLVAAGDDAIADPFVSFDGESVYYTRFHNVRVPGADRPISHSADIFKIHVKSRKIMRLTHQEFTPNTGVVSANLKAPGVYNTGPCPVPGGKLVFTSNRNGFAPTKDYRMFWAKGSNKPFMPNTTFQLFVMDDDGSNVETVGHLNINGALHPTMLKDGRVMFSSFESQGLRDLRTWAIWTIHPDGTNWAPFLSALGASSEIVRHFMTQLSDSHIVWEEYYIQNTLGFGTYYKCAPRAPDGQPFFGPAYRNDPRNFKYAHPLNQFFTSVPFSPYGMEEMTPFARQLNAAAERAARDGQSSYLGKVTQPSGAPDNHLLTVWSPGPVHGVGPAGTLHGFKKPAVDSGIYLIKDGKAIDGPGQMLLIKNDPNYNEQWPRALVPYKRIYGVAEPARLAPVANDGKRSPHVPEGTPFGLVGASSLYKRESYPNGTVPPGKVTATYAGGPDLFLGAEVYAGLSGLGSGSPNWIGQGADAGKYENSEIHAIRIVATEPTTDPRYTDRPTRRWLNAANERLRILGEFPVRKFDKNGQQPLDPDGNPDTSFLVKIPADVAWTFQTLDKNGLVLNMAQTWHQLRPGEIRTDCGGCHAHSQKPTEFKDTAAARPGYAVFDLTSKTPLLTAKQHDQSGKQWDRNDSTGLRFAGRVLNVEYHRDIRPIFERSCVACHTQRLAKPAGNLVLDDDRPMRAEFFFGGRQHADIPGTFARLANDPVGKFGHKPQNGSWGQASRYVRYFQSRRSLLAWKIFGQRLDGWKNEDFAYEAIPGDPRSLVYQRKPFTTTAANRNQINLAYTGSIMPPPDAVAGTYQGPDGKKIKVAPLSDEDRRTIVRWIDLGCPIDLEFDPVHPEARGRGWLQDDHRPTLTLTYPSAGVNRALTRVLVGMYDYDSGLDLSSFQAVADFALDGIPASENLAPRFKPTTPGVWELQLAKPLTVLPKSALTVSVKDKQGNLSRIERSFSVRD